MKIAVGIVPEPTTRLPVPAPRIVATSRCESLGAAQELARVREEQAAEVGGLNALAVAVEQLESRPPLRLLDAARQRGLLVRWSERAARA